MAYLWGETSEAIVICVCSFCVSSSKWVHNFGLQHCFLFLRVKGNSNRSFPVTVVKIAVTLQFIDFDSMPYPETSFIHNILFIKINRNGVYKFRKYLRMSNWNVPQNWNAHHMEYVCHSSIKLFADKYLEPFTPFEPSWLVILSTILHW